MFKCLIFPHEIISLGSRNAFLGKKYWQNTRLHPSQNISEGEHVSGRRFFGIVIHQDGPLSFPSFAISTYPRKFPYTFNSVTVLSQMLVLCIVIT